MHNFSYSVYLQIVQSESNHFIWKDGSWAPLNHAAKSQYIATVL